jgi:ABC-type lipoprotein export system ATPase subunit
MDSNHFSRLEIKGLLGAYSYNLSFPEGKGSSVRFITGPNGYGKTTILYLVYSLFNQQFANFDSIEFRSLNFVFRDGKSIEVKKQLKRMESGNSDNSSDLPEDIYKQQLEINYRYADGHLLNGVVYDLGNVFSDDFSNDFAKPIHDANLRLFLNSQECYWIDERRLINKSRVSLRKESDGDISSMVRCSNLIGKEYEKVRYFLAEDLSVREGADEQKLKDCELFLNNLKLFKEIIASYKFERKELETIPEYEGIRFRLRDEKRSIVLPENLSSGEQQLIEIFFELIFCAPKDSLVLIDEPETSQHLMWQVNFYNNIKKVASNKDLQVIVTTHSPQMFDGKWELSEDLYAQSKG